MIEVVGSKTRPQETDPAQRYVLKETERRSKLPAALSLLLMGVTLYLKSIFPSRAEADAAKPGGEDKPEGGAAEPRLAQAASLDRPPLDETPTGTVAGQSGQAGSAGTLVDLTSPIDYMLIESPDVGFFQPDVELAWGRFAEPQLGAAAANDNSSGARPGNPGVNISPVPEQGGTAKPAEDDDSGGELPPIVDADDGSDLCDQTCSEDLPSSCDGASCEERCDEHERQEKANRAPRVTGPVYLLDVTGCAILAIGLADLLRGSEDPDEDLLSVRNLTTTSGTLTQTDHGWMFDGSPQLVGPVTIQYEITDGEFVVQQTAHFSVVRSSITGTGNDDLLVGTMCADDMEGGDGDDNMDGRAGNDVMSGGAGDDIIVAGLGDDTIFAGAGNDIVFGGAGNDHISGGAGNDRLYGEEGDDIIFGDEGEDYLSGGGGDDLLVGGDGDDEIQGDEGDDTIEGGAGDDLIAGGAGDDVISGGSGNDMLVAGGGDDVVRGGDGDDEIHGDEGGDVIDGGAGNDVIDGGCGDDTIVSGEGDDVLRGGAGDDLINGDEGDDTIEGGAGDDVIAGGAGDDVIEGGAGNDVLADGSGEDTVLGGDGDDRVIASPDGEDDLFAGGSGCDTLDYSNTTQGVTVDLAAGAACGVEIGEDTISGFEAVIGGSGDDHFVAGEAPSVLVGGAGENTFEFPPPESPSAAAPVMHEILDFKVGDRVRLSKYDIFEKVLDKLEDHFEDVYGLDIDDDDIAIRYRQDRNNEIDRTVIEVDRDKDDIFETTINIHGRHVFFTFEQTS
jgi:Ca2+-binding RTX toxin-like protein